MSHMKLIKLLYLVDREALLRWGQPVTYDRYVSMKHGPVLSHTLDLVNGAVQNDADSYWREYIGERVGHEVELRADRECPEDALSQAEVDLLREVYEQFGYMNRWTIVARLHELPEWTDPDESALPISVSEILRGGGITEDEVQAIEEELRSEALAERLFA